MKRARLIPSILMLVLCTAVLAVGIYAVSPTTHSVVGTVKITAGGANVSITGYLDDGDGDYLDDVKVTDTYTSRTTQTINIYANALDFDCSSAFDISEVAVKKLYFKVENLSSYSLGAYFLEGTVGSEGTQESNIAETKSFNGTMGSTTITNLITATFTPYTEVPVDGEAYMYSTLKLNQLNSEESSVTLNLNLNIEEFNEELAPAIENAIAVKNSSSVSVSIDCMVENASEESTKIITNSGKWNIGVLEFSDETFGGQLMLQAIKAKMLIKNNGSEPISVSVIANDNNVAQDITKIEVTTLNNPYIAPGATGEVSVQFSVVYDRSTATPTVPTINTYSYSVVINTVESSETLLSRVKYDDDTSTRSMPVKGFNYYIEYGDNPYYTEGSTTHREKLRWYIWGKDDGTGKATALVAGTDYNSSTNTFIGGGTYFFISEYSLDCTDSGDGVAYQNEYSSTSSEILNADGNKAIDYSGSNIRKYINGETIKHSSFEANTDSAVYHLQNGNNVNFYERYNLLGDILYGQIVARDLRELYSLNGDADSFPSAYSGVFDKFWLMSPSDLDCMVGVGLSTGGSSANSLACPIAQGTANGATAPGTYWLLRSVTSFDNTASAINYSGMIGLKSISVSSNSMIRPAFALEI